MQLQHVGLQRTLCGRLQMSGIVCGVRGHALHQKQIYRVHGVEQQRSSEHLSWSLHGSAIGKWTADLLVRLNVISRQCVCP